MSAMCDDDSELRKYIERREYESGGTIAGRAAFKPYSSSGHKTTSLLLEIVWQMSELHPQPCCTPPARWGPYGCLIASIESVLAA